LFKKLTKESKNNEVIIEERKGRNLGNCEDICGRMCESSGAGNQNQDYLDALEWYS
jgi:hypothetical protein